MNIYEKVQKMRVDLQKMEIKKSGENKFAGYKYYELGDFLPPINSLMLANKVASQVTFETDLARLRLINCEKPDEIMEFTSPMAGASLKGAHDIQNLGAVETYQRRYLHMAAFEIVESDFFDATQGKADVAPAPKPPVKAPQKPAGKPGKKPVGKLSPEMRKRLNDSLAGFSELAGVSTKEVLANIEKVTGKTPATMDDKDGEHVLNIIRKWADETIEKLGE